MFFNSLEFTVFLPIVYLLYWILCKRNVKAQNVLLLLASYVFYGWWDWRFLLLIFLSSYVDYSIGLAISKSVKMSQRKVWLFFSILFNLGILGFFKYCNFFIDSFKDAFSFFGTSLTITGLEVILPVGISFYTFQTLSYTIDVFRKKMKPSTDVISFFAYVSFFPQLVAGPIERAVNLLPQFALKRVFKYNKSVDGLKQIVWGAFKKLVIADNCALYVNEIFSNYTDYSGSTLFIGTILFAFQIYGDFSGYSDMAIGTARLFGFDLMKNFSYPYFSRNIAEFWRCWHISLSTWFRDYLYIPLGGSKGTKVKQIRNVFVIFLVSGFWHGANWTFVAWGFVHALLFLPLLLLNKNKSYLGVVAENRWLPTIKEITQILGTFILVCLAWIFFRSDSIYQAFDIFAVIFSPSLFVKPEVLPKLVIAIIILFLIIEWFGRKSEYAIEKIGNSYSKPLKWAVFYVIVMTIILFRGESQAFIYFQF